MKKFIVAVSGGVDSVVLLDMLAKQYPADELIVAHFDHGIRGEASHADARFVRGLSEKYGLQFELGEGNLSEDSSEEAARNARYAFLRDLAAREHAMIITAHHGDDFLETVALNISRGTGWRGLAVMGASDIARPLRPYTKRQLYNYAVSHRLEFSEDSTNRDERYLRNRLRIRLGEMDMYSRAVLQHLIQQQQLIVSLIDKETSRFESVQTNRYFLTMVDEASAMELIGAFFRKAQSLSLTRPTAKRLVMAIKTARAGSHIDVANGIWLEIKKREFIVSYRGKVL